MAAEAVQIALGGNIKRGIALALTARERAREANDPIAELAALNAASRCHSMNYNALTALSSGIDALGLAEKLLDQRGAAHALCSIASAAFALRLLDESSPISEHVIAEAIALQDDDLEARARMVYGENLGDLYRFVDAAYQLNRALLAAQRLGAAGQENRALAKLATLAGKEAQYCAELGDAAAAEQACKTALHRADQVFPLAKAQKNTNLMVSMLGLRARVHVFRGVWTAARDETCEALALARQFNYLSPIPPWSMRLAAIYLREDDVAGARSTLEDGLRAAESLRPTFRIGELCEALLQLEQKAGNAGAAQYWQNRVAEERLAFDKEREQARAILAKQDWRRKWAQ